MEQPPTTGRRALVLGGGGAYGIVQAAYIQAVTEAGFRPDLVIGTSVGALNGAWVAMYPDDPEGLIGAWRELGDIRVLDMHPLRLASRLVRRSPALCGRDMVAPLVKRHLGRLTFEDTKLELGVVATNLSRGRKHLFREGLIAPAVRASTAIPGVFEPYEIGGELFVDGCITASVDLGSAVEAGATEILAIELAPPFMPKRATSALGVVSQAFSVLSRAAIDATEAVASRQAAIHVLRPDLSGLSPWRLEYRPGLVEEHLAMARREVAGALDAAGRVVPAATSRPRGVVEAPAPRPVTRLVPRPIRRLAA